MQISQLTAVVIIIKSFSEYEIKNNYTKINLGMWNFVVLSLTLFLEGK